MRRFGVAVVWFGLGAGTALAQMGAEHGAMSHAAAKPSTSLSVRVGGAAAVTMTTGELGGLPQKEVTVVNGHTGKEERYRGPALSDVLLKAGAKLGKETLHGYVVAKGTDGYWVLYSGEEVVPTLHSGDVIVATAVNGAPLGAEGALKLVSSEDKRPERWVRNLMALEWKSGVE